MNYYRALLLFIPFTVSLQAMEPESVKVILDKINYTGDVPVRIDVSYSSHTQPLKKLFSLKNFTLDNSIEEGFCEMTHREGNVDSKPVLIAPEAQSYELDTILSPSLLAELNEKCDYIGKYTLHIDVTKNVMCGEDQYYCFDQLILDSKNKHLKQTITLLKTLLNRANNEEKQQPAAITYTTDYPDRDMRLLKDGTRAFVLNLCVGDLTLAPTIATAAKSK